MEQPYSVFPNQRRPRLHKFGINEINYVHVVWISSEWSVGLCVRYAGRVGQRRKHTIRVIFEKGYNVVDDGPPVGTLARFLEQSERITRVNVEFFGLEGRV